MKWTLAIVCVALACNFVIGDPLHLYDGFLIIRAGVIHVASLIQHGQFRQIF
jgi:hypothetical protein